MADKRIALLGCGAQAKYASEIFHLLPGMSVTHVLSPESIMELTWLSSYSGLHVRGFDQLQSLISRNEVDAVLVCIAKASEKKRLYETMVKDKVATISAIHPRAQIASSASVGLGCIINAGAVVQPFAKVGTGVMIHANVVVEHDCTVSNWANLAPGSQLAGWVQVGEGATVYTGASVIPTIKIGNNAVVGAGAVVNSDVPHGSVAVGVPAKPINSTEIS